MLEITFIWLSLSLFTFLRVRFRNGYGMSEMVAAGIVPHPDTAKRTMAKGSIGQVQQLFLKEKR